MDFAIGGVRLPNRLMLAPMAGVTDLPFRLLCREAGCGLVCTEMVSAKALTFHNKKTWALLRTVPAERPAAVQLFGSEPDVLACAAEEISGLPFDIVDFNMGCPVQKIVKNGEGSALMRDPKRAQAAISALVKHAKKPVTVKIRAGFDAQHMNAAEIAGIAEACGAAAVCVHGRTREQFYAGKADWSVIRAVKESVKIPVIGNGDIFSPEDAKRLLAETGCDGVMAARGARGNPWLFTRILAYLETGRLLPAPGRSEIGAMILRHAEGKIRMIGEKNAMKEMRSHIAWYTAGLPHSAALRRASAAVASLNELRELLRSAGLLA